jgi:2-oxoisovalerate dehydrogenase E2 component (dihydrolipoyl transacylase)
MARYEFKLPDIGEGIAEAEIVAWHIKIGDQVSEDQQLADMMTDKATVEMESPVAGTVVALAGEVGDQIPIGSVLVVFETEAGAGALEAAPSTSQQDGQETDAAGDRTDTVAMADGLVTPTEAQEQAVPSTAEHSPLPQAGGEEPRSGGGGGAVATAAPSSETTPPPAPPRAREHSPRLARRAASAPAISASTLPGEIYRRAHAPRRSRRLLLYNGGGVSRSPARAAPTSRSRSSASAQDRRNMQEAKRRIPHFTLSRSSTVTALEQTRAMMNATAARTQAHHAALPGDGNGQDAGRLPADQHPLRRRRERPLPLGAVHMGMATQTPTA